MQAVTMSHLTQDYANDDTEQIPCDDEEQIRGNDQEELEQFPEWMIEIRKGRRAKTFGKFQRDEMTHTTRKVFWLTVTGIREVKFDICAIGSEAQDVKFPVAD